MVISALIIKKIARYVKYYIFQYADSIREKYHLGIAE